MFLDLAILHLKVFNWSWVNLYQEITTKDEYSFHKICANTKYIDEVLETLRRKKNEIHKKKIKSKDRIEQSGRMISCPWNDGYSIDNFFVSEMPHVIGTLNYFIEEKIITAKTWLWPLDEVNKRQPVMNSTGVAMKCVYVKENVRS